MESVTFDGVVLTDRYSVMSTRGVAAPNVATVEVSGRDGTVPRGMTYGCPPVMLVIVTDPTDAVRVADARRELASIFDVRGPRRLEFGNDGGLYYMAQPSGALEWSEFAHEGRLRVPMLVPSPAMYGATRSVQVPSGGSVSFVVGGTYPTAPNVAAAAAVRSSSSNVWGLRLDDGDFVHVPTGSSSSRSVAIDCDARTCKVQGSLKLPTLDSDWLVLEPGTHTLRNDQGSGAATVTWTERWL